MKNWISAVELLERKNSVFVIPVYQRDYVWTDTQVKQLLNDLLALNYPLQYTKEINNLFIAALNFIIFSYDELEAFNEITIS